MKVIETISLLGAGGKMGLRLTANLKRADYEMSYVEPDPKAAARLLGIHGVETTELEDCVPHADAVIFAVPNAAIKTTSSAIVARMKPGALLICLDPAAPYAGYLPKRPDIAYFVARPSHPSVFNWESKEKAQHDFFGGKAAKQSIVCTLIQGSEEDYVLGEKLAKDFYKPVTVSHRVTVEQMVMLQPALSETFAAAMVTIMKEAVDEVVAKGVPKEAAYDFFLGHVNLKLALLFGKLPSDKFSEGAIKAIEIGKPIIFKDDWKRVFEWDRVMKQIHTIT